jgi:hypothetical protein
MLDKIKYIAGYQTAPISAITHYAEVDKIEPYGEDGKYKLLFKKNAIQFKTPILNDMPPGSIQGPRYTSFSKIEGTKNISELF